MLGSPEEELKMVRATPEPQPSMRCVRALAPVLAWTLAATGPLHAITIHVPRDHPTIQGAIHAAVDGDSVLVAPGTYQESAISFDGKAITVAALGTAARTVVQGDGTEVVFSFHEGEDSTSVLRGFEITGGGGDWQGGGGIECVGSSPTIVACVVHGNRESGVVIASSAILEECVIERNTVSYSRAPRARAPGSTSPGTARTGD